MRPAKSTTILSVRRDGQVALGGDGQVTLGNIVAKHDAVKVRRLAGGRVLAGFAGSAADAFALLERFEKKLAEFPTTPAGLSSNWPRTGAPTASSAGWRPCLLSRIAPRA